MAHLIRVWGLKRVNQKLLNMNMLNKIKVVNNPKYLVITPLKIGDKISKTTKKTVNRNKLPFDWICYEGNNNIPTNTILAWNEYKKTYFTPEYIIKIDNDIEMDRGLLDDMCKLLSNTDEQIAYCYCPFSYILPDGRSISFNNNFDKNKLLKQNYISSNSMIKTKSLYDVGGFVYESKYERLLDWALWLRFLYYGYEGILLNTKQFKTPLNENNVSSRGAKDYQLKYKRVYEDFIKCIDQGHNS